MIQFSNVKKQIKAFYYKVVRDRGTPEYIARGWAIGAAVGTIIPISFQLLISVPLSFPLKGSKIGAIFGTFHTNPITIWFIYPAQCYIGNKLIGGDLSWAAIETALNDLMTEQSFEAMGKLGFDLLLSFFMGSLVLAAIWTPFVYFSVKYLVITYRKRMELRKQRRLAKKTAGENAAQ